MNNSFDVEVDEDPRMERIHHTILNHGTSLHNPKHKAQSNNKPSLAPRQSIIVDSAQLQSKTAALNLGQSMTTLALQGLLEETLQFLKTLSDVVTGDDPVDDDADQVKQRKSVLEDKFKRFMAEFRTNKSTLPSAEQLSRLAALRKERARKDAALDALYKQLRDFELEVTLRSGGARKRALERVVTEDTKKALQRMMSS